MSLLLPTTILWKSSNFTQRRVEMRIVTGIFVIALLHFLHYIRGGRKTEV